MFKKEKEDKKQEIINSQKELIDRLTKHITKLETELEIRSYPEMTTYDDAKAFMLEVEKDSVILKEQIEKARMAQEAYENMIKNVEPLVKEYKTKLKELNEAIGATRIKIQK